MLGVNSTPAWASGAATKTISRKSNFGRMGDQYIVKAMRTGVSRILRLSLVAGLVFSSLTGCAKREPVVTVEQAHEQKQALEDSAPPRLLPPVCDEFPEAAYPELPTEGRPELVSVHIDLTIDESGRPTNVEATVLEPIAQAKPFIEAAEAAAKEIICKPAVLRPWPGSEHTTPIPVDYDSSIIYRFYRDDEAARVVP